MWPYDDEGIPLRDPREERKGWHLLDKTTGAIILDREGGFPVGPEASEDELIAGLLIFNPRNYCVDIGLLTDVVVIPTPPPCGPYSNYITLQQLKASGRLRPKTEEEIRRDAQRAEIIKQFLKRLRDGSSKTNPPDPKNT